jgi:MoaA/NifB/PqqE/SkfB family radical SAM enzyme
VTFLKKTAARASRTARISWHLLRAATHRHHPILVHVIPMRRCNLSCTYCNEYDSVSRPVPLPLMQARIDRLAELGTSMITISGGEPLMHPDLDTIVAHIRKRGMVVTLITNGYYLSKERIEKLNHAGLDFLQISIDNVEPDDVSLKSLRLLEPKLKWVAEHAWFGVTINSVVGSGVKEPKDALAVSRRARELGFMTSIGIIHDGRGQLQKLPPEALAVYEELRRTSGSKLLKVNSLFQDNLAHGRANDWSCRAGARYLYVDEDGFVSYCSQQRGAPGTPLEKYGMEDIRREYDAPKGCAPYCSINCVQQVGLIDRFRGPQKGRYARLPPAAAPATNATTAVSPDTAVAG